MSSSKAKVKLSVIIPTLQEAKTLPRTFAALQALHTACEIIVVDAGSTDTTVTIAKQAGCIVLEGPRNRGAQLNLGAVRASGDVFLFLHADTILPPSAYESITQACKTQDICGGNFRLRFLGTSLAARIVTQLYTFLHYLGIAYGDSAFFVRADIFRAMHGFTEIPLFEDLEFYKRLKRYGTRVRLHDIARTASRRFEHAFLKTLALWILLQTLYTAGLSPHSLARWYKLAR